MESTKFNLTQILELLVAAKNYYLRESTRGHTQYIESLRRDPIGTTYRSEELYTYTAYLQIGTHLAARLNAHESGQKEFQWDDLAGLKREFLTFILNKAQKFTDSALGEVTTRIISDRYLLKINTDFYLAIESIEHKGFARHYHFIKPAEINQP
jgi:hypothetical protein